MNEKGITLIALVITIIVMLILAAVSITMAVNGGLFGYAKNASQETENAKTEELSLANGIIGGKTIDEWVNGEAESYIGKYVTYRNTRFVVSEENNGVLTLLPLTFIHDKLLSGKYILVDEKPVSIELDNSGNPVDTSIQLEDIKTDETAEAFRTRIGQELDNACKDAYEKTGVVVINVTSTSAIGPNITVILPTVQEALVQNDFTTILTLINEFTAKAASDYNISSSNITSVKTSDCQGSGQVATMAASTVGNIAGLGESDVNNLKNGIIALNSGMNIEDITSNQTEQVMIQIGDAFETYIIVLSSIPSHWNNNSNEAAWYVHNSMNIIENNDDHEVLVNVETEPTTYKSATHKLAPVLTVSTTLLQAISQNEYQINN